MGQYWKIVNIDKRVYFRYGLPSKLGVLFFNTYVKKMLHALTRMPHENADGSEDQGSKDEENVNLWVGDRIICLGDYADDMPDGILSVAEEESLKELAKGAGLGDLPVASILYELPDVSARWPETKREDGELALRNLTAKLYVRSLPLAKINPGSDSEEGASDSDSEEAASDSDSEEAASDSDSEEDASDKDSEEVASDKDSEEVASDSDSEEDASDKDMFGDFPGFMQVLLMNICWSSDPSTSMQGVDIGGSWAGHRFDIVKLDDFRDELNNGSWTDVSKETVRSLRYIWMDNEGYY